MFQEINLDLFQFLNAFSSNWVVESIVMIFADAPIFFIPLFLVGMWFYFGYHKKHEKQKELLFIFYSIVIAILISLLIQHYIHIDRPEIHLANSGKLLLKHLPDASFPSDHASVSIAFISSLLLFGYKKLFYVLIPFFFIMLISRIIAGVHWPFDIIAGICIGILSGIFTYVYITQIKFVKKINSLIIKISKYLKI